MSTEHWKLPETKFEYTNEAFDIITDSEGISPSKITEFISDNEIGTPATRHNQFAELKEPGIVKKVGETYVIDKRGLILASTYQYYLDDTWSVISRKKQLRRKNQPKVMIKLLAHIQPIKKAQEAPAIAIIKSKSNELIEGEKDLATLEGF